MCTPLYAKSYIFDDMRVWDVNPGYLNDQSLLGEHREAHALFSIVLNHKKGYSAHPETKRWKTCLGALAVRHEILVSEMELRGFIHRSPVPDLPFSGWPDTFIDPPVRQFAILKEKYRCKSHGRIPLPDDARRLWAQHKYSVLARDQALYLRIGREVAVNASPEYTALLSELLVKTMLDPPKPGNMRNALDHMWGYVSSPGDRQTDPARLIREIRRRALEMDIRYLIESTALSDLAAWTDLMERNRFP